MERKITEQQKKRIKKKRRLKKKVRTGLLLLLLLLLGTAAGTALYVIRGKEQKEALGNSRNKLSDYNIEVMNRSVEKAEDLVKEDGKKAADTAKGLQEAWQAMWPKETEITQENKEDFAVIEECIIMSEDISQVKVSGRMEGIPKSDDRRLYLFNLAMYQNELSDLRQTH